MAESQADPFTRLKAELQDAYQKGGHDALLTLAKAFEKMGMSEAARLAYACAEVTRQARNQESAT